jgi:hypothetical protein
MSWTASLPEMPPDVNCQADIAAVSFEGYGGRDAGEVSHGPVELLRPHPCFFTLVLPLCAAYAYGGHPKREF